MYADNAKQVLVAAQQVGAQRLASMRLRLHGPPQLASTGEELPPEQFDPASDTMRFTFSLADWRRIQTLMDKVKQLEMSFWA